MLPRHAAILRLTIATDHGACHERCQQRFASDGLSFRDKNGLNNARLWRHHLHHHFVSFYFDEQLISRNTVARFFMPSRHHTICY